MTSLEENLNPAAAQLYRTALRASLFRLLNDVDFPGQLAQQGRAWLQAERRSTLDLERFKERCVQVLREIRTTR